MMASRTLGIFFIIAATSVYCDASISNPASQPISQTDQNNTAIETQRNTFLAAENALNTGRLSSYRQLKAQLIDYPLLPYLEYGYLNKRLNRLPTDKIELFLSKYIDTPLHDRLLSSWLTTLSAQGRWQQYLEYYESSNNVRQQCLERWALLKTGKRSQAFDGLEQLWVVGRSQPKACDQIFSAWQSAGQLTTEFVWQRFQLAIRAHKTRLARYLVRFLPENEQIWAKLWLRTRATPSIIMKDRRFMRYHAKRNEILIYALERLASRNLDQAVIDWDTLRNRYAFTETQHNSVERTLALRHALQKHPDALSWLASLSETDNNDPKIGEWRIRAALDQENWEAVLQGIDQLDVDLQSTARWQYWRARAAEALNKNPQAHAIYRDLAQKRGYYSFLAADRLGLNYNYDNQPVRINTDDILYLTNLPGLQRAHELFKLGYITDARREWLYTTQRLPEYLLPQAATIAQEWGWHDQAIMTMAKSSYRDDLNLRFPLPYSDEILEQAHKNNLDPALAFAIIRQESAFTIDARSHTGALGLMQLMPRTAQQTARRMGIRLKSSSLALTNSNTNLKLGMSHLSRVMNRYQNNPVLATAAYNAGEYRVKQWIPEQGNIPADIWTETMPFIETRNYVQNIMYFTTIYQQRLGGITQTSISQRMPPISSPDGILANDTITQMGDPS